MSLHHGIHHLMVQERAIPIHIKLPLVQLPEPRSTPNGLQHTLFATTAMALLEIGIWITMRT